MADSLKSSDVPSVTGMVVVNPDGSAVGAPVGGATAANQTNGSQKTQIVTSGGTTIDSFGGGTQYTEGDTDATITGTAIMWEDAGNALTPVSSAKPLPVSASIDTTGLATSATDTSVASIDSKTPALGQALAAASTPVVLTAAQITTLTPPAAITGFGTAANQTTIIGHLDGVEGLLTTIDGDTGTIAAKDFATQTTLSAMNAKMVTGTDIGDVTINNASGASAVNIQDGGNTITVDGTVAVTNSDITSIKTAVEVIDNAISGSEMQVDVVAALPAGTNAIGKLAANSGVDIGDVDVTSLPALAAGTNTIGAVKSVPSDIDINGSNANHTDKYYTNAGAVTDGIIWSPAAGKRWHVLNLTINVSAACTVTIEDDLAAGDNPRLKFELAANSGITIPYNKEHPFSSGEDAADLLITTTAGNVYVQAIGYEV